MICAERRVQVIDAMISLANSVIIRGRLIRKTRHNQRWDTRPKRKP